MSDHSAGGTERNNPLNDDWRREIVENQSRDVPKERGNTYYYADGLFDQKQFWLKHNPGCNTSIRVNKVYQPGFAGDDYNSFLEMNIGTEMDAYRLYRALEAYFNDVRTPPWFLQDHCVHAGTDHPGPEEGDRR